LIFTAATGRGKVGDNLEGYYCIYCCRFIEEVNGVIVHDTVYHPEDMIFTNDEVEQ
jgi:hypothetical protein